MREDYTLEKKRFLELGRKSYNSGIYTFTDFLGLGEQSAFAEIQRELSGIPYTPFGGTEGCERVMIRFGSEELCGYDMLLLYSPWDVKAICEKLPVDKMPIVSTFGEGTLRLASENHLPVKAFAPSPAAPSLAKAVDLYIADVLAGKEIDDVEFAENEQNEEFLRTQQTKLAKKSRTRKK